MDKKTIEKLIDTAIAQLDFSICAVLRLQCRCGSFSKKYRQSTPAAI